MEKNRKINNRGGDDFSGLESTLVLLGIKLLIMSYPHYVIILS